MSMTKEVMRVDTVGAKYTVVQTDDGLSHVLRHGEPWDVYPVGGSVGNVILALANELMNTRAELAEMVARVNYLEGYGEPT